MENKSKYIKFLGVSALAIIALLTVMYIPVMATEDATNRRLLALKMRGVAFSRGEEGRVRNRVRIHVWMCAERVNRAIRLHFRNGSITIDGVTYVFKEGRGVIGRFHCADKVIFGLMLLRGEAVNDAGEIFNFTMFGRVIIVKQRSAYIAAVGFLKGETQSFFLLLEGLTVPVRLGVH